MRLTTCASFYYIIVSVLACLWKKVTNCSGYGVFYILVGNFVCLTHIVLGEWNLHP